MNMQQVLLAALAMTPEQATDTFANISFWKSDELGHKKHLFT